MPRKYPRAGLFGNPSDIFGGKTISLVFNAFTVTVTLYETPSLQITPSQHDRNCFNSIEELAAYRKTFGYYGGIRLIEALIVRFYNYCQEHDIRLEKRNFTIEYSSSIPFGIGLAGSTAIIKAALCGLMQFYGLTDSLIPKPIQANLILEAELKELDISAGPQDRVAATLGGLVYMDFSPEAYETNNGLYGHYEKLNTALLPPLFTAFSRSLSESSGKVHNIMRYRVHDEHDQKVITVMKQKAEIAARARELLLTGKKEQLGPLMQRDFLLRKEIYHIAPTNQLMIDIAEGCGTYAKFTGSGGAVIGIFQDEKHLQELTAAYRKAGFEICKAIPMDY